MHLSQIRYSPLNVNHFEFFKCYFKFECFTPFTSSKLLQLNQRLSLKQQVFEQLLQFILGYRRL